MKKVVKLLSLVVLICLLVSCIKDAAVKKNIEGTWGLVYSEASEKDNGELVNEYKRGCNPFAPGSEYDLIIVITKVSNNEYVVTSSNWDPKEQAWISDNSVSTITIKGDNAYGFLDTPYPWTIKIEDDVLTLSASVQYERPRDPRFDSEMIMIEENYTLVFKRMRINE